MAESKSVLMRLVAIAGKCPNKHGVGEEYTVGIRALKGWLACPGEDHHKRNTRGGTMDRPRMAVSATGESIPAVNE